MATDLDQLLLEIELGCFEHHTLRMPRMPWDVGGECPLILDADLAGYIMSFIHFDYGHSLHRTLTPTALLELRLLQPRVARVRAALDGEQGDYFAFLLSLVDAIIEYCDTSA